MAHDQKALTLERGTWNADADRLIALAHQHATIAEIRHQVDHLGANLFFIKWAGHIVGAFVLRVDRTQDGDEGVIVSAAASVPGLDMIALCLPSIEARFENVKAIRFHTANPALARRMAAQGYEASEIVCRKKVNAVQQTTT